MYIDRKSSIEATKQLSIEQGMRSEHKLSSYSIRQHANKIFSYYDALNIDSLEHLGFTLASHIVDVGSDGVIKNRLNQWIKVPGIAGVRGGQLLEWIKKLSAIEDKRIIENASILYGQKMTALEREKTSFDKEIQFKLPEAILQFDVEKNKFDTELQNIKTSADNEMKNIEQKYLVLHEGLFRDSKLLQQSLILKIEKIQDKTRIDLDKNIDRCNQMFAERRKKIKEEITLLEIEKKKILTLQFHIERSNRR